LNMKLEKEELLDWVRNYFSELISGICIFLLLLLILVLKKQYVIAVLGMGCMLAIGIERRAKAFDKMVSILVIFILSVGFVLLG